MARAEVYDELSVVRFAFADDEKYVRIVTGYEYLAICLLSIDRVVS
jgi:hypothetical protein